MSFNAIWEIEILTKISKFTVLGAQWLSGRVLDSRPRG